MGAALLQARRQLMCCCSCSSVLQKGSGPQGHASPFRQRMPGLSGNLGLLMPGAPAAIRAIGSPKAGPARLLAKVYLLAAASGSAILIGSWTGHVASYMSPAWKDDRWFFQQTDHPWHFSASPVCISLLCSSPGHVFPSAAHTLVDS